MPDSNTATPLPDPNPGETSPNLSIVPDTESPTRTRGEYNRDVEVELTKASEICGAAQKPAYAQPLSTRGIAAAFVTSLVADIAAAGQKSQHAVACDTARKDATQAAASAAETLVASLQSIQGAARVQHLPDNPAKLDNYLVGEPLAESRPLLERHSQAIVDKANEERPAGLDTGFINRVQTERAAYVATTVVPGAEEAKAKQDRAERDAMLASIVSRRKKIQYAADSLWPPRRLESVQARTDFKLPATRPYSY